MYVPKIFALEDEAEIRRIVEAHNFGLLITAAGGSPMASHLPFIWDETKGPQGTLLAHMARANPHWRDFAALAEQEAEALAIFQGEHSYISPNWYEPGPAVPTWNYVTVHLYGRPRVIKDSGEARDLLERLSDTHEAGFETPWTMASQPADFLDKMMRGIVAFEMPVTRIEAKAKVSQNRPEADQSSVITALDESPRAADRELSGVMRKILA